MLYTEYRLDTQKDCFKRVNSSAITIIDLYFWLVNLKPLKELCKLLEGLLISIEQLVQYKHIRKGQALAQAYNKVKAQYQQARSVDLVGIVEYKDVVVLFVDIDYIGVYEENTAQSLRVTAVVVTTAVVATAVVATAVVTTTVDFVGVKEALILKLYKHALDRRLLRNQLIP